LYAFLFSHWKHSLQPFKVYLVPLSALGGRLIGLSNAPLSFRSGHFPHLGEFPFTTPFRTRTHF